MNLSGIQPRFCLSEIPFWVQRTQQEGPLEVQGLLQPFLSALFNKIPHIRPNVENVLFTDAWADFGRVYNPNNSTGMIRFFVFNECDFSLLYDQMRLEAFDYVDYSSVAVWSEIKIVSSRPINRFTNTFKLVDIFDNAVWISLLFSMSIISLLLKVNRESKLNVFTHFLNMFAILLFQGSEVRVKKASRRVFWSLWILSFFILSASFCSKLLSQLALPDTLRYFDSLRDFIEFPKTIIRVAAETALHYLFLDETNEMKKTLMSQVLRMGGLYNVTDLDLEMEFDEIVAGRRIMIMDEHTTFAVTDMFDKCDIASYSFHFSKENVMSILYSFVTRKGFNNPVSKKWKLMLSYYFEGGNFDMDFHFARIRAPKCLATFQRDVKNDYVSLTLTNIYFPLLIWIMGGLICSAITFLEICKFLLITPTKTTSLTTLR